MAESELAVLTQCLSRHIPDKQAPEKEVLAGRAIEANATRNPTDNSPPIKLNRLYRQFE